MFKYISVETVNGAYEQYRIVDSNFIFVTKNQYANYITAIIETYQSFELDPSLPIFLAQKASSIKINQNLNEMIHFIYKHCSEYYKNLHNNNLYTEELYYKVLQHYEKYKAFI